MPDTSRRDGANRSALNKLTPRPRKITQQHCDDDNVFVFAVQSSGLVHLEGVFEICVCAAIERRVIKIQFAAVCEPVFADHVEYTPAEVAAASEVCGDFQFASDTKGILNFNTDKAIISRRSARRQR
jgi:hypothetical protein